MTTLESVDDVIVRVVYARARGYLPADMSVEDLVQDARLAVWRALQKYRTGDVVPLVVVIAQRTVVDAYRKARTNRSIPVETFVLDRADPRPGPEETALRSELRAELRDLLASLTKSRRDAVVLRALGYTQHETAERLGINRGAASVRAHRGITDLRRALGVEVSR